MKPIFFLLIITAIYVHPVKGQQKIGVVDIDATVAEWNKAVKLDIMLNQKRLTLQTMVETWLDKLQEKYDLYDKKTGTIEEQNTLANDILDGQEEILNFERIQVDSIPIYRRQVLQLIEDKIQETIDAVAIANEYDLIIAKDNILFYRGEEIDELIVTFSELDLRDIQAQVELIDIKLSAWIRSYTNRIEEY